MPRCHPALLHRALRGFRTAHLQRDHRGRRVLDQRLRLRAWRPVQRACRWTRTCTPSLRAAFYEVSRSSRSASCAAARAPPSSSRSPSRMPRTERRRHARGEDDRQLTAGEDGRARRGPELGTHRRRRRTLGRAVRRRSRHGARRRGRCSSNTGCRTTTRRRSAAEHLKGSEVRIDVDLGTGGSGTATVWTCDLSAEYVRINGEYRT